MSNPVNQNLRSIAPPLSSGSESETAATSIPAEACFGRSVTQLPLPPAQNVYPGTYLPRAPVLPASAPQVTREINYPARDVYFPGTTGNDDSRQPDRGVGSRLDPDSPYFQDSQPGFMKAWVNPGSDNRDRPSPGIPGLPKPRMF